MHARRTLAPALPLLLLLAAAPRCQEAAARPNIAAVGAIAMTVGDLERAVDFYTRVLPFTKTGEAEVAGDDYERLQGVFGLRMRVVWLKLGDETLALHHYLAPEGRPFPAGSRGNDLWFQHVAIVVRDMQRAYQHLRAHGVRHASPGPQRLPDWNASAGGIEAFYFRDPDGHFLEVLRFPAGKGDARWQQPGSALFLGIDHTAITVRDTETSLAFWRDTLGLRVAGGSENWGPEQERLNNVFGARLRITTLRAPSGPGVELLEYLTPQGGRERPAGALANDLLHWQIELVTAGLAETALRGTRWLSPGAVATPDRKLGITRGLTIADPDGHAVQVVERAAAPSPAGAR